MTTRTDKPSPSEPPKPGEIRVFDGKLCRFIERELEGDKWEVLGPADQARHDNNPTPPAEGMVPDLDDLGILGDLKRVAESGPEVVYPSRVAAQQVRDVCRRAREHIQSQNRALYDLRKALGSPAPIPIAGGGVGVEELEAVIREHCHTSAPGNRRWCAVDEREMAPAILALISTPPREPTPKMIKAAERHIWPNIKVANEGDGVRITTDFKQTDQLGLAAVWRAMWDAGLDRQRHSLRAAEAGEAGPAEKGGGE